MSFFAILFALLLEQVHPVSRDNPAHAGLRAWVVSVRRNFDAGKEHHGWVAWGLAVVPPALLALGGYWLLMRWIGWPVALLWNVLILYVTLGFRQFSHNFTDIRDALERGDEQEAREAFAKWRQVEVDKVSRSELLRRVIEYSVISAHRHVFGVLFWFVVLAALGLGPAGAVIYRVSEYLSRYWSHALASGELVSERLKESAQQAWMVIDWLPARITAMSFAIVGNFEEAIDGWRFHTKSFPNDNDGVILAATAGAINVRLGGERLKVLEQLKTAPISSEEDAAIPEVDVTPGREADFAHLRSVVGLVWRSVVVWMLLLALLSLAHFFS